MAFIARQEPFVCEHCGTTVEPLKHGTYRNHCPQCLWGKHVDDRFPGDRRSLCGGMMEPTGVEHRGAKGWMIVHRCRECEKTITNTMAPDDDQAKIALLHP